MLTDDEMFDALKAVDQAAKRLPPGFRDFARAVEAAATAPLVEQIEDLQSDLHDAAVECARLKADAERYRWLRKQEGWPETEAAMSGAAPEAFDNMIDDAMRAKREAALQKLNDLSEELGLDL